MLKAITAALFVSILFTGCNNSPSPKEEKPEGPLVLTVEVDSAGNITTPGTTDELVKLAKQISADADKVMLHSYVESTGNVQEDLVRSQTQAQAAKQVMVNTGLERMYYNVGVDAHGSTMPIKGIPDTSTQNRRIEIEFL